MNENKGQQKTKDKEKIKECKPKSGRTSIWLCCKSKDFKDSKRPKLGGSFVNLLARRERDSNSTKLAIESGIVLSLL